MKTLVNIFSSVLNRLVSDAVALKDYRTDRHIVVLESDDWGSIRMSSKKHWDEMLKLGYAVDKRPYERFDTLESPEDIEALFEVLHKYQDCQGNHPLITANMLMVNPDFERIEKGGFNDYYYEPIAETYKRYYGDTAVLDIMRQGMTEGVFMPQSHGREHFNVRKWIDALRNKEEDTLTAFHHGMCGIAPKAHPEHGNQMLVALLANNKEEQSSIDEIVNEGLRLFEQLWGFKSQSFIAPCYCWNEEMENILAQNAVCLIQAARDKKAAYQSPVKYYYSGEKNKNDQYYSIRNCTFEPSTISSDSSIGILMKQLDESFKRRKIAVFSTHRINYVGGLFESNRTKTLSILDDFLKQLIKKYPDIEFLSSNQLFKTFQSNNKQ